MNEKLNKIIKDEIGVDDGSFMPDAAREPWILLLSSLTAWRKIKSSPIRLFYSPFGAGQCSKSSRTTCTLRFLRAGRPQTGFNNYAGGPGSKYLTH